MKTNKKVWAYISLSLISLILIAIATLLAIIVVNDIRYVIPKIATSPIDTVMGITVNIILFGVLLVASILVEHTVKRMVDLKQLVTPIKLKVAIHK